MLLNPAWSSPWSPHFPPALSPRLQRQGGGLDRTPLPLREEKEDERMRLGRSSMGCEGKVSIKAMRPSASLCLTAGLSGADSQSAGWLPRLAHRSALSPTHPRLQTGKAGARGHRQQRGVPSPAPRDAPNNGNYHDLGLKQVTASLEADGSEEVGAGWDGRERLQIPLK